ncbi:hypothetical protein KAX75_13465, partial [candidate division WOR-3 bacterium]|nr:hypothetical protein [candidate division WOR-3 bacterium]
MRKSEKSKKFDISSKINVRELFRISYEKQVVYFVLLLLVFFGFTEIVSLSYIRKMEYKWLFSRKAEFSVLQQEVEKILTRPPEEVKQRLRKLVENPSLRRVTVFDSKGDLKFDTSPYPEKVQLKKMEGVADLRIERRGTSVVTSYWFRFLLETGDSLFVVFFSPEEDIPFLLGFLRITSYIKLSGTFLAFILGGYFILFVLSPFKKMGKIAKVLKKKDVTSVEEIVLMFNETIGELKRLYAKEKKKVRRMEKEISLKEHLASLGEMSAGIAHEFKNSLGSIIGFTKLAMKEGGKKEYLEKVKKESDALNRVVNEFLFFAKPQKLEKESFLLKDIVSELIENRPENIEMKIVIEEIPKILADKQLLKRAFS